MMLKNIILPKRGPSSTWDIEVEDHIIKSIKQHPQSNNTNQIDPPSIILPSLCHPHVHLDKAYLLTSASNQQTYTHSPFPSSSLSKDDSQSSHPDYQPLQPKSGSFGEALSLTSQAKELYTIPDLLLRGGQLLSTSLRQGVTSCRAFVEVDHVTQSKALTTGLQLKEIFKDTVKVQIVAFAQDPVFSGDHGDENREWMEKMLGTYADTKSSNNVGGKGIDVLGTTPYVEADRDSALRNIEWAITSALKWDLHLDFHLDYNLDKSQEPMVWDVIRLLKEHRWVETSSSRNSTSYPNGQRKPKTIVLGHCSRLTLFSSSELSKLAQKIHDAGLRDCLSFVGLPTSDLFMMGRPPSPSTLSASESFPLSRPRGTLNLPALSSHLEGVKCCIGVNNMGNAFTPFGTGDPLELASWCVGKFHAGTEKDAEDLYWAVSAGARECIGLDDNKASTREEDIEGEIGKEDINDKRKELKIVEGMNLRDNHGLLLVRNEKFGVDPDIVGGMEIPARWKLRVRDVVWETPGVHLRSIIR